MHGEILLTILASGYDASQSDESAGYLIGGIIALLVLGYLIYTLFRPEKF